MASSAQNNVHSINIGGILPEIENMKFTIVTQFILAKQK